MKKTAIALVLAGVSGLALAQGTPSGAAVLDKSISKSIPAAVPSTSSAKPGKLVNPFTGKELSAEQVQRELEAAKSQTQMLEEQLKQLNLTEEMRNVPLRKAVEAAQAQTAVKKEEVARSDMDFNSKAARAAATAATTPTAPKLKKGAKTGGTSEKKGEHSKENSAAKDDKDSKDAKNSKEATESKPVKEAKDARPAAPVRPVLLSVISIGTQRSVLLEFNGGTMIVPDGDMSPFGPVQVVDENSATVGGTPLKVHSATLARFVVSDPKPVTPGAAGGVASAPVIPIQATSPVAAPAASVVSNSSPRNALPPLQLPPGVSVLPAPR